MSQLIVIEDEDFKYYSHKIEDDDYRCDIESNEFFFMNFDPVEYDISKDIEILPHIYESYRITDSLHDDISYYFSKEKIEANPEAFEEFKSSLAKAHSLISNFI